MTTVSDPELTPTPLGLDISFAGGPTRHFSWRWLRDHDQSPAAYDAETAQRRVDTFAIDAGISSTNVAINGTDLVICWRDQDATSLIDLEFLSSLSQNESDAASSRAWSASSFRAVNGVDNDLTNCTFDFADLTDETASDNHVAGWLDAIREQGFALVSGIPNEIAETERLVRRIAPPLETIFGQMWTVESGSTDHADSAYSNDGLEPHTDGTYVHDAPGLQLLHFVHQAGDGGASVLVDGVNVVQQLQRDNPDAVAILRTTPVPAHYIEPGVELRATRPALRFAASVAGRPDQLLQLSFNNYDRSPMWLEPEAMDAFYAAYSALHDRIIDPANQLTVAVQPGQALVFDNWRVLHGRTGFTGRRVFNGAYIARDRFDSKRRVTAR